MATWRFVAGTLAALTNELTEARTRAVRFAVDAPPEASFSIDGLSPQASGLQELITELYCYRDTDLMFRGRLGASTDQIDADAHALGPFTVGDYKSILARRILYADQVFTTTDAGTIAWNLIDYAQGLSGGALGITAGTGAATGQSRTVTYAAGKTVLECIDELSKLDPGFEWEIDPLRKLNIFTPTRGAAMNTVLEYGARVMSVSRQFNPATFANALRVSGGTGTTADTRTAADIATRTEGRWDRQVGESDVTQQAVLDKLADLHLTQHQTIAPEWKVTLRPDSWQGKGSDFWLGDTVRLIVNSGRLAVNALVRVRAIRFTIDDHGNESIEVELTGEAESLDARLRDVDRRLRRLERR